MWLYFQAWLSRRCSRKQTYSLVYLLEGLVSLALGDLLVAYCVWDRKWDEIVAYNFSFKIVWLFMDSFQHSGESNLLFLKWTAFALLLVVRINVLVFLLWVFWLNCIWCLRSWRLIRLDQNAFWFILDLLFNLAKLLYEVWIVLFHRVQMSVTQGARGFYFVFFSYPLQGLPKWLLNTWFFCCHDSAPK